MCRGSVYVGTLCCILSFHCVCVCVCVCVFSQGRYCEAVDQWEVMKEAGVADAGIYTSVMKMATTVGGVEAAQHVKEDMERQDWNMDHRYTYTSHTHYSYIWALLIYMYVLHTLPYMYIQVWYMYIIMMHTTC